MRAPSRGQDIFQSLFKQCAFYLKPIKSTLCSFSNADDVIMFVIGLCAARRRLLSQYLFSDARVCLLRTLPQQNVYIYIQSLSVFIKFS